MTKKTIIIALAVLALVLVLPWPWGYSRTLHTTKFDSDGNNLGTVDIAVSGFKTHSILFGERLYTAKFAAFDEYGEETFRLYEFHSSPFLDYRYRTIGVVQADYDGDFSDPGSVSIHSFSYSYSVSHSPDYRLWWLKLASEGSEYCYVGSFDGDASTTELIDFFDIRFGL